MKIDLISNYDKKIMYSNYYFKKISFTDNKIIQLLQDVGKQSGEIVKKNLNMINNQNIQEINFDKFQYKHRDNILGFTELSKAESIFLVATIADIKQREIWLHTDITQLTRSTLKLFIKLFWKSPYINIMYDSELSKSFYDAMKREALHD